MYFALEGLATLQNEIMRRLNGQQILLPWKTSRVSLRRLMDYSKAIFALLPIQTDVAGRRNSAGAHPSKTGNGLTPVNMAMSPGEKGNGWTSGSWRWHVYLLLCTLCSPYVLSTRLLPSCCISMLEVITGKNDFQENACTSVWAFFISKRTGAAWKLLKRGKVYWYLPIYMV